MSDILADYREWRSQQAERIGTHSPGCHLWHDRCMIHRLAAEVERLRLTDAEREAIAFAICSLGRDDYFNERVAERLQETLERLTERLK